MREPGPADIGTDATVVGGDETLAPPASLSRVRTRSLPSLAPPPDVDRSSLTPAERTLEISRYILLSRLGAGGMGLVYLAHDPALDRKVAIKLLRPGDDREPAAEAHARLHREAQALAKLSHPNVVAVYDVGTYDARALYGGRGDDPGDGVFLVMEYVEGVTLARWLDERTRPWRDVLAVFLAAGHGLAAAHAVGILHRDFKPSNVLVKRDGSVHVFDFGLARAAGGVEPMHDHYDGEPLHTSLSSSLSAPLTQIGAVVGTPVYMAPEQRGGEDIDERSDQFSFCVALYEGIFGVRPFSGENFYALEVAKLAGTLDPPRRTLTIPGRLRRAIVRGLAGDPALRWPSLAALLAELERVLLRRRRRRALAAALSVAAIGLGLGLHAATREPVCADAALGDVWSAEQAPTLERSFVATGLPYAADTWQRTRDALDRHALAWRAAHRSACEATNVARTQSPERMDRRMRCLDHRRDELHALVGVFAGADGDVVDHAVSAVAALTPIAVCDDPDIRVRDPAVEAEARVVAQAAAETLAGHFKQARSLAERSLAAADELGDRSLQAEAALALGDAQLGLSELPAAERSLTRAHFDAVATAHDTLAAEAAISLVALIGDRLAKPTEGRAWARHADALLDRIGRPPNLDADYLNALGNLDARSNAYAEAEPLYRRALALVPDDRPLTRASYLTNLASSVAFIGRVDDSVALYLQALALREQALGPDHPSVAHTLTNLGGSYALLGDTTRAEATQRRALAIWRASLPPRHDLLAYPLSALGDIALEHADYTTAAAHFEEARAIWEHNAGPEFPSVASMVERLATTRLLQGDVDAARRLADRAVDLWSRSAAPDTLMATMALIVRSQVAVADGDLPAARGFIDRALAGLAPDFPADHLYSLTARMQAVAIQLAAGPRERMAATAEIESIVAIVDRDHGPSARWLVEPLLLAANAYLAADRITDARNALTRAAPIAEAHTLVGMRAEIDLGLARIAWADGDPTRAHSLATAAAAVFRRIGARRSLADAETWTHAHPPP